MAAARSMNPSATCGRFMLMLMLVLVLVLVLIEMLVLMFVLMHGRLIVRVPVLEVAMPGAHGSSL
jgi:hypothetical protein